jgi:hypothetical protein
LHCQACSERPERRTEPGQPEKEPDDSRLFCLTERAGDQRERHRPDGGTGQSVEGARYQEHSTRLRERCQQGCAYHAEGTEHEHATPAIDVTRNAAGEDKGAKHQLAEGNSHLHDRGRCTQVAAHRTQRKVRDCGAQLVREADQHASGKKATSDAPPAWRPLALCRWLRRS